MKFLFKEKKVGLAYLLSLVLLFSISFVYGAVDTASVSDVFNVNREINYIKPCINNGTFCSSAAICNYTFYNRDNSIIHNNVEAENIGANTASLWQYNISHTETGLYKVDMVCVDSNLMGSETLYYEVAGGGFNNSLGFYVIVLILSLGVVIIGYWMEDAIMTIFGSFGLYFLGIYILNNGLVGTKDLVTTWATGLIVLGIAMYVSIRSAHSLIVD